MKNTSINAVVLCCFIVLASYVGPVLDDNSAENITAKQEFAKQRQQERFERAARDVCGPNAAYKLTQRQGEVVCMTKRGHKTGTAAL